MNALQNAAKRASEWTERRDALIRLDTRSLRQIAADAGLSHTAIAKIRAR
jgi:hypothetical protein